MCPPCAKRDEAPESAKTALLRNFARYLRVNARLNRQITSKFGFSDLKLTKVDMSHFAHVILKTVQSNCSLKMGAASQRICLGLVFSGENFTQSSSYHILINIILTHQNITKMEILIIYGLHGHYKLKYPQKNIQRSITCKKYVRQRLYKPSLYNIKKRNHPVKIWTPSLTYFFYIKYIIKYFQLESGDQVVNRLFLHFNISFGRASVHLSTSGRHSYHARLYKVKAENIF